MLTQRGLIFWICSLYIWRYLTPRQYHFNKKLKKYLLTSKNMKVLRFWNSGPICKILEVGNWKYFIVKPSKAAVWKHVRSCMVIDSRGLSHSGVPDSVGSACLASTSSRWRQLFVNTLSFWKMIGFNVPPDRCL